MVRLSSALEVVTSAEVVCAALLDSHAIVIRWCALPPSERDRYSAVNATEVVQYQSATGGYVHVQVDGPDTHGTSVAAWRRGS